LAEYDATADGGFRELALRLLSRDYPESPHYYSWGDLRFLPQQLPADLPFQLPIGKNTDVIASIARPHHTWVFLEARGSAQATMDFFLSRLVLDGWIYMAGRKEGFARVARPEQNISSFWHRERHAFMWVALWQRHEVETEVRLEIVTDPDDPRTGRQWTEDPGARLGWAPPSPHVALPCLLPPRGDEQWGGVGAGDYDSAQATGGLRSSRPVGEIAQHYADAFRRAGWEMTAGGEDPASAWHTWARTAGKKRQRGIWFAVREPGDGTQYTLFAQMRSAVRGKGARDGAASGRATLK
jgi:hypothetical protein